MKFPPFDLKTEATQELYQLIDEKYRKLPKTKNGSFDSSSSGFQDNDIDALRHAFVSGAYTQSYGFSTAEILGRLYEYFPGLGTSSTNSERSTNMDLWNNAVGRKYGKKTKNRLQLFNELLKALKNGELITDPNDKREYTGLPCLETTPAGTVVVIGKDKMGRNILFYDLNERIILSRSEFVNKIRNGKYTRYCVRVVNGTPIPVARRDSSVLNNLG
jgi:hypothetical protein